jgi:hypothetical protein
MSRAGWIPSIFLSCLLFSSCAHHYRVYDYYSNQYRPWNGHERTYYHQWAQETHRQDRDFRKLNKNEQTQYWAWRHQQGNGEAR